MSSYIIIILAITSIFGCFIIPNAAGQIVPSKVTSTTILSSCTNTEPEPQTTPNLSYAKSFTTLPPLNHTCEVIPTLQAITPRITWYYYSVYPPDDAGNCTHNTSTSTLSFTTETHTNLNGNFISTSAGFVSAGPFLGQNVTRIVNLAIASQTACNIGPAGLEIVTGTVKLDIVNGPSCTGIIIGEYCPGIHSQAYYDGLLPPLLG